MPPPNITGKLHIGHSLFLTSELNLGNIKAPHLTIGKNKEK